MNDKKILHIIEELKKIQAINEHELVIENNFIFIPPIELMRNTEGKWIGDIPS